MQEQYQAQSIESQAQVFWEQEQTFKALDHSEKEKFYCLYMFPYPSGRLHMGHVRNYTLTDVMARFQRMQGKNVLHPPGWDAFGLPAENAALKHNVPPAKWTYDNIAAMSTQIKRLGFGLDWSREIATCKPEYYKWEQWFFIQLYKKGLVYKKNSVVNWDPVDHTVLANEQVIDGRGWRSGALVEKKEIPQWFLKITAYADQLLNDLDKLTHWPERVKTMQRNWIGRSEGLQIQFKVADRDEHLSVFTTRPDTLCGVTYLAIAPAHPLALAAAALNPPIAAFAAECKKSTTMEADLATAEKKGLASGFYAIHPLTEEKLPIWIANFVVMDYGTGAVMSVPAHDQRDFEFAQKYQLPLKQVIDGKGQLDKCALTEKGKLIHSGKFDGLDFDAAFAAIAQALAANDMARITVNYRLRDWGVSRQRYWGAPIPMIICEACGDVPVPEDQLPVVLPENVVIEGTGSPLKRMPEFYEATCPQCKKSAKRETDTFDTFMESSWYYARYACPDNDSVMLDQRANHWLPVDHYVGGIEHAILHLLYSRFYHKLMRDQGLVKDDEPFKGLLTLGMVLKDGAKMSKSKGNTVDPQDLIEQYGADTARLFIMFAAPPEQSLEWSDSGVEGAHRFIKKLWQFAYLHRQSIQKCNQSGTQPYKHAARHEIHDLLRLANSDMARAQYNTVVSGGMKMLNALSKAADVGDCPLLLQEGLSILLRLLNPIIPHVTHALWQKLGFGKDISHAPWPQVEASALLKEEVKIVVQVNGKVRAELLTANNAEQKQVEALAQADGKLQTYLSGKTIRKVIYVPNKLLSYVVGE